MASMRRISVAARASLLGISFMSRYSRSNSALQKLAVFGPPLFERAFPHSSRNKKFSGSGKSATHPQMKIW